MSDETIKRIASVMARRKGAKMDEEKPEFEAKCSSDDKDTLKVREVGGECLKVWINTNAGLDEIIFLNDSEGKRLAKFLKKKLKKKGAW